MLNFETGPRPSAKRARTNQLPHDDRSADLIERAALALAVDKSAFLRAAIGREVARVLEMQARHVLTPEDAGAFAAALDAPPAPTPHALEAARNYRSRVVHAD